MVSAAALRANGDEPSPVGAIDPFSTLRTYGRAWVQRHGRRAHQALSEAFAAHDPAFSLRWEPLPASDGLSFRIRLTRDNLLVLSYRLTLVPTSTGLVIEKRIGAVSGHEAQPARFRGRDAELVDVPALDHRDILADVAHELHLATRRATPCH